MENPTYKEFQIIWEKKANTMEKRHQVNTE